MLSPTKQSVLQSSSRARVRRYSRSRSAVHAMQVISASRYRPALRPAISLVLFDLEGLGERLDLLGVRDGVYGTDQGDRALIVGPDQKAKGALQARRVRPVQDVPLGGPGENTLGAEERQGLPHHGLGHRGRLHGLDQLRDRARDVLRADNLHEHLQRIDGWHAGVNELPDLRWKLRLAHESDRCSEASRPTDPRRWFHRTITMCRGMGNGIGGFGYLPPGAGASSDSRTKRSNLSGLNGFWRQAVPWASFP